MPGVKDTLDRIGNGLVVGFQLAALFVIGATIVWTAVHDYLGMIQAGRARLDDILLLFIYLELGTMVGIYFKTDRLPVLFLLYIAITAMTRFIAVDNQGPSDSKRALCHRCDPRAVTRRAGAADRGVEIRNAERGQGSCGARHGLGEALNATRMRSRRSPSDPLSLPTAFGG